MTQTEANSDRLLDENDTWSNCEDWEEEPNEEAKCPFCPRIFEKSQECFQHCVSEHEFDFYKIKQKLNLDFYSCMKLVNFTRLNGAGLSMDHVIETSCEWLSDKSLLKPVFSDDALLYGKLILTLAFDQGSISDSDFEFEAISSASRDNEADLIAQLRTQLDFEKKKNLKLQTTFNAYKEMVESTLMEKTVLKSEKQDDAACTQKSKFNDKGNYYFESYAANEIHESMLRV
jgi:protein arginine N-methyltransferase 3